MHSEENLKLFVRSWRLINLPSFHPKIDFVLFMSRGYLKLRFIGFSHGSKRSHMESNIIAILLIGYCFET